MRRPCQAKKKTNRVSWKRSYHRRKWAKRAANKIRNGDLSANHVPLSVIEDGQAKWLCTTCGKLAKRPKDLGSGCSGTPGFGVSRYWRKNQSRLADHAAGRALTAGRNKPRTGALNQPEDPGLILRCLARGQAAQAASQHEGREAMQEEGRPEPRPQQVPQIAEPAPGRARITVNQELARLFGTPPSTSYIPSQEDFPALPGIREASHSSSKAPGQGQQLGPQRPRSRSPRTAAWQGHSGSHMEGQELGSDAPKGTQRGRQEPQAKARRQSKPTARKRQEDHRGPQEGTPVEETPRQPKSQKTIAKKIPQPTTKEATDRRKQLDKEGFSQVFARRTKDNREGRYQSAQTPEGTENHGPEPEDNSLGTQEDQREPLQEDTGCKHSLPGSSRQGSSGSITLFNRYAQLEDSKRAEEVVTEAEKDKEEQVRDAWDQESRLEDLAHRKQSWHAAKFRKITTQHTGRGVARSSQGSGPQGSEGGGTLRKQTAPGPSRIHI